MRPSRFFLPALVLLGWSAAAEPFTLDTTPYTSNPPLLQDLQGGNPFGQVFYLSEAATLNDFSFWLKYNFGPTVDLTGYLSLWDNGLVGQALYQSEPLFLLSADTRLTKFKFDVGDLPLPSGLYIAYVVADAPGQIVAGQASFGVCCHFNVSPFGPGFGGVSRRPIFTSHQMWLFQADFNEPPPASVPEPASLALLMTASTGALALSALRRRSC